MLQFTTSTIICEITLHTSSVMCSFGNLAFQFYHFPNREIKFNILNFHFHKFITTNFLHFYRDIDKKGIEIGEYKEEKSEVFL